MSEAKETTITVSWLEIFDRKDKKIEEFLVVPDPYRKLLKRLFAEGRVI